MKIGIDIGGTAIKRACLSDGDEILITDSRPTPKLPTPKELAEMIADLVEDVPCDTIGCTVPGSVSKDGSKIFLANALGWREVVYFADELTAACKKPVRISNDGDAAAIAEARLGAGRGFSRVLMLTLGTGVGGSYIVDGKVPDFFGEGGGELGHIPFARSEEKCGCGLLGCFELYGRAASFEKYGLEQYSQFIAEGLTGLIDIFRPEVVVLGGGVAAYNPEIITRINAILPEMVYASEYLGVPEVRLAEFGGYAGAIGAAIY